MKTYINDSRIDGFFSALRMHPRFIILLGWIIATIDVCTPHIAILINAPVGGRAIYRRLSIFASQGLSKINYCIFFVSFDNYFYFDIDVCKDQNYMRFFKKFDVGSEIFANSN